MFEIIIIVIFSLYILQAVIFFITSQFKYKQIKYDNLPAATVLVAARDEEENILRCMESLSRLKYPKRQLEIIILDDGSSDSTPEIVKAFIENKSHFKYVRITDTIGQLQGKANALAQGVHKAAGEIILTTDADCVVSETWAATLASYYTDDVAMVMGYTSQRIYGPFSGMQHLDFIYLLVVAAGIINAGLPLSCIGNNMSYRKKAYLDVGGYEGLPFSVTEDSALLKAIDNLKQYKIIYPMDKDAHVVSEPVENYTKLYRQKKRWAVGGLNVILRGFVSMSTTFAVHIALFAVPFLFTPVIGILTALKFIGDFVLLYLPLKKLGLTGTLKYFPVFELYYTIYVIVLPFIMLGKKEVIWKGRKF